MSGKDLEEVPGYDPDDRSLLGWARIIQLSRDQANGVKEIHSFDENPVANETETAVSEVVAITVRIYADSRDVAEAKAEIEGFLRDNLYSYDVIDNSEPLKEVNSSDEASQVGTG